MLAARPALLAGYRTRTSSECVRVSADMSLVDRASTCALIRSLLHSTSTWLPFAANTECLVMVACPWVISLSIRTA